MFGDLDWSCCLSSAVLEYKQTGLSHLKVIPAELPDRFCCQMAWSCIKDGKRKSGYLRLCGQAEVGEPHMKFPFRPILYSSLFTIIGSTEQRKCIGDCIKLGHFVSDRVCVHGGASKILRAMRAISWSYGEGDSNSIPWVEGVADRKPPSSTWFTA